MIHRGTSQRGSSGAGPLRRGANEGMAVLVIPMLAAFATTVAVAARRAIATRRFERQLRLVRRHYAHRTFDLASSAQIRPPVE